MTIILRNKDTLEVDEFVFKCCVGKNGLSLNKKEGDKKTPKGIFNLGHLYFRADKIKKIKTNLKLIKINKNMGWCNDCKSKNYNKLIKTNLKEKHEKLYRKDYKYDLFIPILYNFKNPITNNGSCIFLHLTNNYYPTAGCIALKKKDFIILAKLINPQTKIQIL
jgi:L,D-peptidoglycan transpeptidase YkuD (ErfK/YbiS/YcfS/YnhG family)